MGKKVQPDDYFQAGPLEVARFGKNTLFSSNWNEGEHSKFLEGLADRLPEIKSEIDVRIARAVKLIRQLPALELLYRAYWQMADSHMGMASESEATKDSIEVVQTLEFIHNVVASHAPLEPPKEVTEKNVAEILKLVGEIHRAITFEYLLSESAKKRKTDEVEKLVEDFRHQAIVHWVNVRGERYTVHEKQNLEDLLMGQDSLLRRHLGVSARELIDGFVAILDALTVGLPNAMREYEEVDKTLAPELLKQASESGLDASDEVGVQELYGKVIRESGLEEKASELHEKIFGLALFDLQKVTSLPTAFLNMFSWDQGEEKEYFGSDEFAGWPLKTTPLSKRPFLKVSGRFYCFSAYGLCDNLYRTLEKKIRSKGNAAAEEWRLSQEEITEDLPIKYLRKILPSSTAYKSVYYRWFPKEGHAKREWCEVDGLIIFEDHLIIIEVKAPAFTAQSPFDRFDTHMDSLKKLVAEPVRQGARFFDYLEHDEKVTLFDEDHKAVGTLEREGFRCVTVCALSIDPFTELASKAHRLGPLGVDTKSLPVWALSLDDLRTSSELFNSPLIFLHYLEKRTQASQEMAVDLDDELDHVGLYFEHNDYALHAADMSKGLDRVKFTGYRAKIDEFFHERLFDQGLSSPFAQKIPLLYQQIFENLEKKGGKISVELSSFLLDLGGDARRDLDKSVSQTLSRQSTRRKVSYISMAGEVRLTTACWQPYLFSPERSNLIEHAKTELLFHDETDRVILELSFDRDSSIRSIGWSKISSRDIQPAERDSYIPKIELLKARRLNQSILEKGKTRRNDKCPCGSGRKYKKCCL